MKISFITEDAAFTGTLNRNYGYAVQRQRNGTYYGKRNSRGYVPPDGHLLFLFACAEMAKRHILFEDIRVSAIELHAALLEAHKWIAAQQVQTNFDNYYKIDYTAADILNLKTTFGL